MGEEGGVNDDESLNPEYKYEYYSPDNLLGQKPLLSKKQLERIQNIEKAATNVRSIIQKYGNASLPSLDPSDCASNERGWEIDRDSAWADTSFAMKEIADAREEMIRAWDYDDSDNEEGMGEGGDDKGQQSQEREWWKSIIANGDELTTIINDDSAEAKNRISSNQEISDHEEEESSLTNDEEEEFQLIHMEWATNAFAEELEALRKGQLEKQTSTRRIKKSADAGKRAQRDGASSSVELDPTQYSFVVADKKGNADKDQNDGDTAAADEIDVQVLADMLQSGSSFLSVTEKKMLLRARQRGALNTNISSSDSEEKKDGGITLHERRKRELGFLVVE
ncbi:hypothetical protein ACHAXR_010063 [Thalassiosira sp. AJA248-18]